jgi:hypothetical protein
MAISLDQMRQSRREFSLAERIYGRKRSRLSTYMQVGAIAGAAYFAAIVLASFVH